MNEPKKEKHYEVVVRISCDGWGGVVSQMEWLASHFRGHHIDKTCNVRHGPGAPSRTVTSSVDVVATPIKKDWWVES